MQIYWLFSVPLCMRTRTVKCVLCLYMQCTIPLLIIKKKFEFLCLKPVCVRELSLRFSVRARLKRIRIRECQPYTVHQTNQINFAKCFQRHCSDNNNDTIFFNKSKLDWIFHTTTHTQTACYSQFKKKTMLCCFAICLISDRKINQFRLLLIANSIGCIARDAYWHWFMVDRKYFNNTQIISHSMI